jgi:hypothetical protein
MGTLYQQGVNTIDRPGSKTPLLEQEGCPNEVRAGW